MQTYTSINQCLISILSIFQHNTRLHHTCPTSYSKCFNSCFQISIRNTQPLSQHNQFTICNNGDHKLSQCLNSRINIINIYILIQDRAKLHIYSHNYFHYPNMFARSFMINWSTSDFSNHFPTSKEGRYKVQLNPIKFRNSLTSINLIKNSKKRVFPFRFKPEIPKSSQKLIHNSISKLMTPKSYNVGGKREKWSKN